MRARPRRALQAPLGVRVARVAVPAVAAGALITTAAVSAWPSSSLQATPATQPAAGQTIAAQTAAAQPGAARSIGTEHVRAAQADRANRGTTRPTLTATDEKAIVRRAAQERAAKKAKKVAVAEKKAAAEKKVEELQDSIIGARYTTAALKLRTKPAKNAESVDIVDEAKKLKVTDEVTKGYRQVVVDGKARWVTNEYLSKKKPSDEESAGISGAACSKSSGIESGLVANGKKAYRAICAAFPEVTSFGGRRGGDGGFHGSGQAVDCMISDAAAGWRLANWARANAGKLGISEVIYSQKIWTVQRSGEGWRGMSDRGSATANHYDHVHVSVY